MASVQPAGREAREKGPVAAGLTPHSRGGLVPAAALLTADLLFQGSARGPTRPAGRKSRAARQGCTDPCLFDAAGGRRARALTAPTRVHMCSGAPLSPSRPPVKGLSVLETSAEWKFRHPGVESADDCVSIPREPCKEENLVYNRGRNTRHASQFKRKSLCFTRDGTLSELSELTVVSSPEIQVTGEKQKHKQIIAFRNPQKHFYKLVLIISADA